MPTYDYKCQECSHTFEFFQKMTDESLTNCPVCNGPLKRLIGPGAGPLFKGTGFYQTDYKNKTQGNQPKKNFGLKIRQTAGFPLSELFHSTLAG